MRQLAQFDIEHVCSFFRLVVILIPDVTKIASVFPRVVARRISFIVSLACSAVL
jgi:hypothetical protein